MPKGVVTAATGSWYTVHSEKGEDVECRMRGKFRLQEQKTTNPLVVGDYVKFKEEPKQETGWITEILERHNYIIRSTPHLHRKSHIIAANLDQSMLLVTWAQPPTSLGFIDRFLATSTAYEIPAVIVFNKWDIYSKEQKKKVKETAALYENIGYKTYFISAQEDEGLSPLKKELSDQTTLLAGHSGVGKSTLINQLIPDLRLKTKTVSQGSGKGRHATSYAAMYSLPFGGWLIDTPGIKEFELVDMEPLEVAFCFPEMHNFLNDCQFNNCLHHNEPKCAVKQAVEEGEIAQSRYKNYLKILKEVQWQEEQRYK